MDGDQPGAGLLERNPWVTRRKFDVTEYYRLAEAGILHEDDRVELIEGEIVAMVPIGSDHSGRVNRLTYALMRTIGERGLVTVQNPLRLSNASEPQPDILVLRPRTDFYTERHPQPEDVLLLVEVSNSSLRYDRAVKLPLYARHRIPEVWIVDVAARAVEVHRDPGDAGYATVLTASPGHRIEPPSLPGMQFAVGELIG